MKLFSQSSVSILLAAVVLAAASGFSPAAETAASGGDSLNDGYSLFYDFCQQESGLSLLLWIKTTPPDIADYAKQISSSARDDIAILKKFSVSDASMRLDKVSLPPFELAVRSSMADDRKQQLIWNSSGAAFAQAVAMTQSEATNYGLHVAKILSETDPNLERAAAMRHIYEHWLALHAEAYKLGR